jgi:DNA-binding NarL/FixJ family response regulator
MSRIPMVPGQSSSGRGSFRDTAGAPVAGMPVKAIRLLIVAEHPLVRCALSHIAGEAPDVWLVGEASAGSTAVSVAAGSDPDVAIIDGSLARGDGWRLARELRDRHPRLGIVMITPDGSDDALFRALESGASAFLSDSASVPEILSAIRHCAVAPLSFSAAGMAQALRRRDDGTVARRHVSLSERERQVLGLLREGRTVPQVAGELYVSLSTAKTYVARLYEKLGASNRAQALMRAVALGLFEEEAQLTGQ